MNINSQDGVEVKSDILVAANRAGEWRRKKGSGGERREGGREYGSLSVPGMVLLSIGLLLLEALCVLTDALCPCPSPCPCPCLPSILPLTVVLRLSLAEAAVELALSVAI